MLLLWSRSAALALLANLASLATCSPVSPPPLKAVNTTLRPEPAHRNEQLTNLKKSDILVPPTLDFNSTSILTRRFSHEVLPAIALSSPGKTYRPGDKVFLKWDESITYIKADIWIYYRGNLSSSQMPLLYDVRLTRAQGYGIELPSRDAIPWNVVTGDHGVNAKISATVLFRFSRDQYVKDTGVSGKPSKSFFIQKK